MELGGGNKERLMADSFWLIAAYGILSTFRYWNMISLRLRATSFEPRGSS